MEITVTINAPALSEAINNLANAIAASGSTKTTEVVAPVEKAQPAPAPQATPTPAPQPTQAAPVNPAPVAEATQTVAPTTQAPAPQPTGKPITLEALCEAGAKLVEAGKMEQVIAMLTKYGVQAINQLPAANYEAFATELRGIGGQI